MYKDLLVYLNGTKEDNSALAFAEHLAVSQNAFLTGLLCTPLPEIPMMGEFDVSSAGFIQEMRDKAKKEGDVVEEAMRAKFKQLEPLNELRRLDGFVGTMGKTLAREARVYDLTIAIRDTKLAPDQRGVLDALLFTSGRACIFVPENGTPRAAIDTIVVGWRNTPESARAVAAAMPLLVAAKKVIVALVIEHGAPEHNSEMPGADIARHLGRHGAEVELRQITGWSDPGAALLNEVEMNDADLLVMGGYGHSRLRERVLGGATREVLADVSIPLLMAH